MRQYGHSKWDVHADPFHLLSLRSNFIIDALYSPSIMKDPGDLLRRIKLLTGVIEVGLFVDMCEAAYFGNQDGTITSKSRDGSVKDGITFDVLRDPTLSSQ